MTALLTIAAVLLDAALGEPRRWHPLVGFGRWARYLENRLNPVTGGPDVGNARREAIRQGEKSDSRSANTAASLGPSALRLRGILALLMAVLPWVLLVSALVVGAHALAATDTSAP